MTDAIEKFDINAAAEKLKAQIRSAFIELLTPEQFKDMVQTELKRFTEEQKHQDHWGKVTPGPSEFTKLCREIFAEHIKTELKALLNSSEFQGQWGSNGRQEISEAVRSWLTANSKELIQSTVLALAGDAAQQMVESLRSRV